LQDCQSKCTASYGYTCTPNGCITGSLASPGIYNTLQECQITCTASYGFTCTPNGCVTGSVSSPGIYSSVAACIAACTGSYGWNCTSTGCVPGNPAQTGSYLTQQACEAACPTGWNCTGPSIQSASFSGSIVNGFTASGIFTGIPLTESIDSLNIFTNGTSILNPGTFSYNFYPNVPVSFTASFTGKSDSSVFTGSIDFFFNGLSSTPDISVKNIPTNTSSSVTSLDTDLCWLSDVQKSTHVRRFFCFADSVPLVIVLREVCKHFFGICMMGFASYSLCSAVWAAHQLKSRNTSFSHIHVCKLVGISAFN
jgi:hypothetical protein